MSWNDKITDVYTIGVFAVILDKKGRILLSHRNDMDVWNMPGGGMEANESPQSALVREVLEETGLKITVTRLVSMNPKPQKNELVLTFECRITAGQITLTDEADAHRWFSREKLPLNMIPKHLERLIHYFHNPDLVFLEVQSQPGTRKLLEEGRLEEFNRKLLLSSVK